MSKRSKICFEIKRSLVVGTVGAVSLIGPVACTVNPISAEPPEDAGQTQDADTDAGDADTDAGDADTDAGDADAMDQQDSDDASEDSGDDSDDDS